MIVIGIDPGSRYTGIGIVSYIDNQSRYLYSARVRCTPKATLGQRLLEIEITFCVCASVNVGVI